MQWYLDYMKRIKKILIALGVSLLLVVTSVSGTLFYYYTHPDSTKHLIARMISKSAGMTCSIETLSYSLDPLTIRAEGITLGPFEDQNGFRLRIADFAADMVLEGRFGHKTLIIEQIRIHSPLLNVPEHPVIPEYNRRQETPSFLSRISEWAVRWFMFRDISLKETAVSDGQITALFKEQRMEIKGIRVNMNPEHLIGISCNLILEYPSQGFSLTAPEIHISTPNLISLKNTRIVGFLEATDATFQGPELNVMGMEAKGTIQYSPEGNILDFEPIEFQANIKNLRQDPNTTWPSFRMKAQFRGSLNIEDRILNITEFDLNADDTLQLEGKMDMGLGAKTEIRMKILKGFLLSDRLLSLFPDNGMKEFTVNASGPILFHGEIDGRQKQEGWSIHTDMKAILDANGISYIRGQTQFDTELSGDFRVSGELPKFSFSADLKSEQIGIELGTRNLHMKQVQIKVKKGEMDIEQTSLFLPQITFESSLLSNIHASLALEKGLVDLKLHGQDVHLLESAHMFRLIPSEWRFDGHSDLKLSAVQNKEKGWTLTSQIGLRHLAFENLNAGYLGEALSLLLDLNGGLDSKGSTVVFQTALTADEGEILLDRFYLDLSNNGLSSSLEARYDIPQQTLQLSSHQIQLENILALTLEGTLRFGITNPRVDLSIKVPKTSLKPLFHHFVLEPFQTENPFLASLDMAGDISADLRLSGTSSEWMIKGHGWWNGGRFTSTDMAFDFSGIDLDLPIWFQAQENGKQSELVQGRLFIQNLHMPIVDNQPLRLSLKMGPNQLSVDEPTILAISNGVAEVGPILFENIMSSKRSFKTNLRLDGIDADSLFSQFFPLPVHGVIKGELADVRFEENTISSSGQIRAQVFGGEIHVFNPGISSPFSSFPLYKANINIKDLNLYELTKGTSFGEIEGILEGYIHNLEIANKQPQKFDLLLETVKVKGVDQEISVRAVDNISRIGGGSSPFMGLAGALAGFIQKFPYSKIGIRASLLNDSFRINGTIKENGQEYLVKRGSFSGVNVVNRNPDTWISFKDMVKRIGRVTASKKDPEID